MSQETFLRAKLELELREVQAELSRLEAERLRLARKNELLTATLYALRSDQALSEPALQRIEEALSFDGQPWSSAAAEPDCEPFEEEEEEAAGPPAK